MGTKLTKTEKRILDMYLIKKLSIKDIANARGTRLSAVYKIIRKLIKKGHINPSKNKIGQKGYAYHHHHHQKVTRYFRLHNIHLTMTPYYFYKGFSKNIGAIFSIAQYTITVNSTNIEMQLKQKESYDSEILDNCFNDFRHDLERLIPRLENRLSCEIWKDDKLNIKLVNHHIAEVENGIAKADITKPLKIYGRDGRIWAVIDLSTRYPELETIDSVKAKDDMVMLQEYLNDLRYNSPPTNSQLLKQLAVIAQNQAVYNENIRKHLAVLDKMGKTLDKISRAMGGSFLSRQPKRLQSQQSLLWDYI